MVRAWQFLYAAFHVLPVFLEGCDEPADRAAQQLQFLVEWQTVLLHEGNTASQRCQFALSFGVLGKILLRQQPVLVEKFLLQQGVPAVCNFSRLAVGAEVGGVQQRFLDDLSVHGHHLLLVLEATAHATQLLEVFVVIGHVGSQDHLDDESPVALSVLGNCRKDIAAFPACHSKQPRTMVMLEHRVVWVRNFLPK